MLDVLPAQLHYVSEPSSCLVPTTEFIRILTKMFSPIEWGSPNRAAHGLCFEGSRRDAATEDLLLGGYWNHTIIRRAFSILNRSMLVIFADDLGRRMDLESGLYHVTSDLQRSRG
ncbi:hypothetical protein VTN49DRAFT_147 [Thermomyces lanuginosus]|uniref:uncharacterized protein n=1 Tax=Thermomyces lanuginosus TaxID=5541 RepID=UPI003742C5C3